MFDATDNPLKLNKRTGSVTRRNIPHPNWQVCEENRQLHPTRTIIQIWIGRKSSNDQFFGSRRNCPLTAAGLGGLPA